jgi:hypothetical protein
LEASVEQEPFLGVGASTPADLVVGFEDANRDA